MIVTRESLEAVDNHWAVLAVGAEARDRALAVSNARLVKAAVGEQIEIDFEEASSDEDLLQRVSMAYEMAAIEGLRTFVDVNASDPLREQCIAGASRAFEIRRLFRLPTDDKARIFEILRLAALAYCGDRWSDIRRWLMENKDSVESPVITDASWQDRILFKLFECWVGLFRKSRWEDLSRVNEIVASLREDQETFEADSLQNGSDPRDRAIAFRLISLYHWAKATEILATYMGQGEPNGINSLLDKHFEAAIEAAAASGDSNHEVLMRWLHATSRQMVAGSIWWVSRAVNSRVTKFVREVTKQRALFELLPPQRAAIQEAGLLDQAATAVVIDMPTSGGKTLLAQFRMLQALNQFDADDGWVAYVAPTRALTAQITRRLHRDFAPIGVRVQQLSGAVEVDAFEEELLAGADGETAFDVLVATPEKLQLIIRNKKVQRPLALVVMDEAHNIENVTRGLRMELLLATVKRECTTANFLLLMPYVEKAESLARWLAQDVKAGRSISFGTTAWKPNERIVGMYRTDPDKSVRGGWRLKFQTLVTTPKTIHLQGTHDVDGVKPLNLPKSSLNLGLETAAMAKVMSGRGTSIAVANNINTVWSMARQICAVQPTLKTISEPIRLVQNFLRTEIGADFELVGMLSKGIGVHHAGLSDEARTLVEWLAEDGHLRVLCATSTIAQGINFPVSSVFLASRFVPTGRRSVEMPPRDFWNLAGRAGRMGQDSLGVVGLAEGTNPNDIIKYVMKATGALVSNIVKMLDQLEEVGRLQDLDKIIYADEWEDFRCYIAHLWNEKKNLEAVLADTEQLLRNTYGYGVLRGSEDGRNKAERLLEATKSYARELSNNPGHVALADMTGFSPEGVRKALTGLGNLERNLTTNDWMPESLFGQTSGMSDLIGVMLRVPQLSENLKDIGGTGDEHRYIADITKDWVNGRSVEDIAKSYFKSDLDQTSALTNACKAIYRAVVNTGTWGVSALSQLSGIDYENMDPAEQRRINVLPAMIYHGVRTEEAVLMRMNSAPRSIAESLGLAFNASTDGAKNVLTARQFLSSLDATEWDRARPSNTHLSGAEYKKVWELLAGE